MIEGGGGEGSRKGVKGGRIEKGSKRAREGSHEGRGTWML